MGLTKLTLIPQTYEKCFNSKRKKSIPLFERSILWNSQAKVLHWAQVFEKLELAYINPLSHDLLWLHTLHSDGFDKAHFADLYRMEDSI